MYYFLTVGSYYQAEVNHDLPGAKREGKNMRIIKAIALFPVYLLLQILRGLVHVLVAAIQPHRRPTLDTAGVLGHLLSIAFREWHQTFITATGMEIIYGVYLLSALHRVLLKHS